MRVASILLAGALALVASAQTTTGSAATTTVDAASAAASSAQAESIRCIKACKEGDVTCQAKCIAVPSPNESQVNATTKCVAECPQGKGSEADTEKYTKCVEACIGANYFTSSAGTPQATSGSGSSSGSGNSNGSGSSNGNGNSDSNDEGDNTDASGTEGSQASPTETAASETSTGAGQVVQISGAAAGLVGFMAAVLAL